MARIEAGKTYVWGFFDGGGGVICNRTLEVDIGGRMGEMYLGIVKLVESAGTGLEIVNKVC
jgi:hypothetical protein